MYRQAVGSAPLGTDRELSHRRDLDVTVVALPQHLALLRQTARSFAAGHGVPRPDDVRLAVSEAALNAVQYAYPAGAPGPVRVHGTSHNGWVTITVEDHGLGLRPAPLDHGLGLGLPIVARVADRFSVESLDGGGTRVRMAFATGPGTAQ
jgi:anti-sigma regulatory factor (Ser/Thr protein kinase)